MAKRSHRWSVGASGRVVWRLGGVAVHLVAGLMTVAWVYPWVGTATRLRLKQRWSARLLTRLGVDLACADPLRRAGAAGTMIVANHVSWLDIFVINAVRPAAFVCKDDVRRWPLIGWLCSRTDTIFIARGSARDARQVGADIAGALRSGACVAVFPEGTTSDGRSVLPLRSALLQPAVDRRVEVQALLIRYRDRAGALSDAPVYVGDTSLVESMRRIAATPRTIAEISLQASVDAGAGDRRALAAALEASLRAGLAGEADRLAARRAAPAGRVYRQAA